MQNKEHLLQNWEAITSYLPYLTIADILKSSVISKTWNYNVSAYIKKALLPEQYHHLNPYKALKTLYNRKIVYVLEKELQQRNFPYLIESISVGNMFTSLKTIEGEHYFVDSPLLQNGDTKTILDSPHLKKISNKFTQVQCVGTNSYDYLYCIQNNQLFQYKQRLPEDMMKDEKYIEFQADINHFYANNKYCFVCCGLQTVEPKYFIISHSQLQPIRVNMNLNISSVVNDILFIHNATALVISEGCVYEVNFLESPIKPNPVKMLKGKKISKIMTGKGFYLAFELKKRLIEEWSVADVVVWAEQNNFRDYIKIFKAQKIDGKKLINMDQTYMKDSLGITSMKTQQKLKLLLEQSMQSQLNPQNYQIYGWGKNDKGQLGMNPFSKTTNLMKPKIPEDCFVWRCVGNLTILKKITSETYLVNTIVDEKLVWQVLTDSKIWSVGMDDNTPVYLGSIPKKKIHQRQSEMPIEIQKKKMKTAKNVLDKILWDEKLKKQDFKVGYMDRYEGMLELELEDFLKGDEKQHKIYYFKTKGKIVWDRNARIDIL